MELGYFNVALHVLQTRYNEIGSKLARAWLRDFCLLSDDIYFCLIQKLLRVERIADCSNESDDDLLDELDRNLRARVIRGGVKRKAGEESSGSDNEEEGNHDEEGGDEEEQCE